jgi:hypothetical protein
MKTTLLLTNITLVATLIASSANADCIIDSKCNPEKYGQQRRSNDNSSISVESYRWWRSYRGDPECAGLPRLEYALCRQGRRIQGF